jgi:hypothetical protein
MTARHMPGFAFKFLEILRSEEFAICNTQKTGLFRLNKPKVQG